MAIRGDERPSDELERRQSETIIRGHQTYSTRTRSPSAAVSACTCISSASTPIASTCVSRKSANEICSVAHTGSNVSRCARMWAEVTSRSHAIEPSAIQRSDEACNLIEPSGVSSLAATSRRASAAARS